MARANSACATEMTTQFIQRDFFTGKRQRIPGKLLILRSNSLKRTGLGLIAGCFTFLALASLGRADSWQASDDFLKAVRFVESCDGIYQHGDGGMSLGDFQISEAAWLDVNSWRKARKLPLYAYNRHVFDRKLNRQYASIYFTILQDELRKRINRPPSPGELYAAYNLGLTQFAQCNFELNRVNATTRRKCRAIDEFLKERNQRELAAKAETVSS